MLAFLTLGERKFHTLENLPPATESGESGRRRKEHRSSRTGRARFFYYGQSSKGASGTRESSRNQGDGIHAKTITSNWAPCCPPEKPAAIIRTIIFRKTRRILRRTRRRQLIRPFRMRTSIIGRRSTRIVPGAFSWVRVAGNGRPEMDNRTAADPQARLVLHRIVRRLTSDHDDDYKMNSSLETTNFAH